MIKAQALETGGLDSVPTSATNLLYDPDKSLKG